MDDYLRHDLVAIVLEEAFDWTEQASRMWDNNTVKRHDKHAAQIIRANDIVNRIDSRCSKIEG